MAQSLDYLKETPSQTAGPYVHIGLTPNFCGIGGVYDDRPRRDHGQRQDQAASASPSTGRVIDGAGAPLQGCAGRDLAGGRARALQQPVRDCAARPIRISPAGAVARPMRRPASLRFETIKPGRVPFQDGRLMAPHISFWIVARGINLGLHTRMYFSDEGAANAADPVLARIEHRAPGRRR